MTFDQLKEKALNLPLKPGVYLMMDREGTVIYVGKAKEEPGESILPRPGGPHGEDPGHGGPDRPL